MAMLMTCGLHRMKSLLLVDTCGRSSSLVGMIAVHGNGSCHVGLRAERAGEVTPQLTADAVCFLSQNPPVAVFRADSVNSCRIGIRSL